MAYLGSREDLIAFELARSGGNVPEARAALRDGYETFRTIGLNTIRRYLHRKGFSARVAKASKEIARIQHDEVLRRERERVAQEMRGSEADRLAQLATLTEQVKALIESDVKAAADPEAPKKFNAAYLNLLPRLLEIYDRRVNRAVPAISSWGELEVVLKVIGQKLQAELGSRAGSFMESVRKDASLALVAHAKKHAAEGNANASKTPRA